LRSFPPSKPLRRVSPQAAFQYSDQHCYMSLGVSRWIGQSPQSAPDEAQHNLLHGVPRSAGEQGTTTLSVICFLWFIHFFSLEVPFPGEPSPCLSHCRKAFDYYVASALLSTKLAYSLPFGSGGSGVPCLCSYEVIVILSCLLYAERALKAFQIPIGLIWTVAVPFWSECLNQFHSLKVTTLQTKVPRVSIDHRVSSSFPSD